MITPSLGCLAQVREKEGLRMGLPSRGEEAFVCSVHIESLFNIVAIVQSRSCWRSCRQCCHLWHRGVLGSLDITLN